MNHDVREMAFYEALSCLVIRLDRQENIWFMNRFALKLLGYDRLGQIFGKPLHTVLPVDDAQSTELLAAVRSLEQHDACQQVESGLLHRDGSCFPMAWSLSLQSDETEQIAPTVLLGFDASAMQKSQSEAAMFQKVSDNFSGSIIITDPDKIILYANPALLRMTGYSADEVLGQTPALFKSGKVPADVYRTLWETLSTNGTWEGELINHRKDGGEYIERKTIAAIRDVSGQVQYYFAIGENVSQRQQHQQHIESLLEFDQLTGLPNRTAFLRSLVGVLDSARQNGKQATVLHIDIDDFFDINDAIGTNEADLIIVAIGARIKDALRQVDYLARLGNDKFAILLGPHDSGIENDIRDVVERILEAVRQPTMHADKRIDVTASIGIASYPHGGEDANELLSHAMAATELVKTGGGNSFFRFDPTTASSASGRRELLNDLRLAVERGEMVLHYQPQVSLFSGAIIGLEALIRWQHPQRGLLPPGNFIPMAEESNHIIGIGEWVLLEACRQMRVWLNADLPPVKVAINLAARHFLVPGLHLTIANALALHHIDPHFLEIEITEGVMMQDVAGAIRTMTQLKEIGVRISLDDFGTGYSSLAYLSRFPIDVVKIDQSFVSDITTNPVNAAIAQATIAMSHKLNKIVLAEGVETEEQMLYLRRNECDEMQGYFFSKPRPADDIYSLLRESSTMNLSGQNGSNVRSIVLFVDDETNILSSIKRTLRREGYEILTAEDATEGFSLLARYEVQVVVSDQRMPGMNGTEFLSRVKTLYPKTVRMVLSGYSEISAVTDSINLGAVYRFMMKPWNDQTLKEEVAGALRHWRDLYGNKNEQQE